MMSAMVMEGVVLPVEIKESNLSNLLQQLDGG